MAAKETRSALLTHLAKLHYSQALTSLSDVQEFIQWCYPYLESEMINISSQQGDESWVIVLSGKYVTLVGSCLGPIKPV